MQAWRRVLKVALMTPPNEGVTKTLTLGDDVDNLAIIIKGTKFLSPMKDEFDITIKNIPMSSDVVSINEIKQTSFRYITIEAGYQEASMQLFYGYIVYISSKREDNGKTVSMHIVCSGSYTYNNRSSQSLLVKAGTDYKTALTFAARLSGINPAYVQLSESLKYMRLKKDTVFDGTLMSMLIEIMNQNRNVFCHCDRTSGSVFQIWDGSIFKPRVIKINEENIILVNGFPTLEDQGIVFTCLPFFNFMPGDDVIIDNESFINRSIESLSAYTQTPMPDKFVDANGEYIIKELRYSLENRGNSFFVTIKCYARDIYEQLKQNWS